MELLVVIAIVALLLAIFIPITRVARERARRVVCLSNLGQLTTAWIAYADAHDGRLVRGSCGGQGSASGGLQFNGWAGGAFYRPQSRSALIENPNKGPLWSYLKDIDLYRCPAAWQGHALTYAIVVAANGVPVEGTYLADTAKREMTPCGRRVGSTVLRLSRLTDITSPGAAQRSVFLDKGHTPTGSDFFVHYLYPQWSWFSPPRSTMRTA